MRRTRGRPGRIVASVSPFVVSLRGGVAVYEGAAATTTNVNIIVDRAGNIGYTGQVQWGVSPHGTAPATEDDFGGQFPADTVLFGANDLTATITITIHGNDVEDGDRTFSVNISNPQTDGGSNIAMMATSSVICTIIDDDAEVVASSVTYDGDGAYYNGNPIIYEGS